jgi:uracil-DNA glycosylase
MVGPPTPEESYDGEMGRGRERLVLTKYVVDGLLDEHEYSIVPAVLCRAAKGPVKPTTIQLAACRPFIAHLLQRIKSKQSLRIIAMGVEAAAQALQRAVTLKDYVGHTVITPLGDITVTYSPGTVLVQDAQEGGLRVGMLDVIKAHVRRFVRREPAKEFPPMEILP